MQIPNLALAALLGLILHFGQADVAGAQSVPPPQPTQGAGSPAQDKGAATFAQVSTGWTTPFPAHRVIGDIYYVGTAGLASYLIATPQGHILINSNLDSSAP